MLSTQRRRIVRRLALLWFIGASNPAHAQEPSAPSSRTATDTNSRPRIDIPALPPPASPEPLAPLRSTPREALPSTEAAPAGETQTSDSDAGATPPTDAAEATAHGDPLRGSGSTAAPHPDSPGDASSNTTPTEAATPPLDAAATHAGALEPLRASEDGLAELPAEVRFHGRVVYVMRTSWGERSPAERARDATQQLEHALAKVLPEAERDKVDVHLTEGLATFSANGRRLWALTARDAEAIDAPSLSVHADEVRAELEDFFASERSRKKLSNLVLSWSLVVFLGLIVFLVLPIVRRTTQQMRDWVRAHPERMPAFRIQESELVSRGAIQNVLIILSSIAGTLLQVTVVYLYLVVCFGLFDATREWVPELNRVLSSPFSTLISRLVDVFPTAALTLSIIVLVVPIYRIIGQVFDSIADGAIEWRVIPAHIARPLGSMFRVSLVLGTVLLFGPLVSADTDSLIARIGNIGLWMLGVALVPMAASFLWGSLIVLEGSYRRGAWMRIGSLSGVIDQVNMLDVVLRVDDESTNGAPVMHRIPHLWLAIQPVALASRRPAHTLEFAIATERHRPSTAQLLARAAAKLHPDAKVALDRVEAAEVIYRVHVPLDNRVTRHDMLSTLLAVTLEAPPTESSNAAS